MSETPKTNQTVQTPTRKDVKHGTATGQNRWNLKGQWERQKPEVVMLQEWPWLSDECDNTEKSMNK